MAEAGLWFISGPISGVDIDLTQWKVDQIWQTFGCKIKCLQGLGR